jgi:Gti1/Pac2 family transcription factor
MSLEPTWYGYVATSNDAFLIFEAVRSNGILAKVTRRPHERERDQLIKSGNIFVFDEQSSGIRRWTDGIAWSPSRILGNFLIYRELERPLQRGEKRRPTNHHRLSQEHSEGLKGPSRSPSPPGTGGAIRTHIRKIKRDSSSNARMINNKPRRWSEEQEKELVGSLTDSYGFKDGGLIMKQMSVDYKGSIHHLVSYYTIDDVMLSRLPSPSQDARLASLIIGSDLMPTWPNFPRSEAGNALSSGPSTRVLTQQRQQAEYPWNVPSASTQYISRQTQTEDWTTTLSSEPVPDEKANKHDAITLPGELSPRHSISFAVEYPKAAAEAILRHQQYLESLVPQLGWQFEVSAGYDIVPEEYTKSTSFTEKHDQSRHFTGNLVYI